MNKLAAGALALALGLGAVAPAVAAETKSYTGAQLVLEKYERELKEANKLRERALIAEERIAAAEAKTDAAKKAYEAAKKAFDKLFPGYVRVDSKDADYEDLAKRPVDKAIDELNKLAGKEAEKDATKKVTFDVVAKNYKAIAEEKDAQGAVKTEAKTAKEALVAAIEKIEAPAYETTGKSATFAMERDLFIDRIIAEYEAYKGAMKEGSEKKLAYLNLRAAAETKQAAIINEKQVKADEQKHVDAYNVSLKELQTKAAGYGWVVQVGNNGVQLVKPEDAKVKAPGQKQSNVAELKRAKADAETAIKAVKLLKELSPEKIKKVEAKLNEKVMKAQELIKKADAKIAELEKKTAFIATAYADEADDTDALIKELDSTTGEIKDLIKDTPEDKKANEEKKPEEKKPEDKKEEKTPSKKAGNNAKTGIAGVAGVAGILAAASVAYAASKRD